MILWFDLETYSDLDLPNVGAWVYSHGCEIMLFAYAIDDGPVQVWDRTETEIMPHDLQHALIHADTYVAQNSQFDRWVLKHSFDCDLPINQFKDTMIMGYACGLPGNLGQLGIALGLDEDMQKLAEGKKLIRRFCMPAPSNHKATRYTRLTHPEEWERFKEYAGLDITAMREIYHRIPDAAMSEFEWNIWHLDQKMNDRGYAIDRALASKCVELDADGKAFYDAELSRITNGAVRSVDKTSAIRQWVEAQGVQCNSVAKANVEKLLAKELPDDVRRVLEIRQEAGKSSVSKYQKMLDVSSQDGRAHGGFQYGGASRTLRWAGRLVQPQNLYRPTIDDTAVAAEALLQGNQDLLYDEPLPELLASCIRAAIVAGDGMKLCVSDLSNIEGRGLAWLAGEQWKLDAYAEGRDLYIEAYSRSFGVGYADVTKHQRQIGKVMELACGYQGGVGAFVTFAEVYSLDLQDLVLPTMIQATTEEVEKAEWMFEEHNHTRLPREQFIACDIIKQKWRAAHPATVALWYQMDQAARAATENGPAKTVYTVGPHLQVSYRGDFLMMRLPSGRFIWYHEPKIVRRGGESVIAYNGIDKNKWVTMYTYGGKLVENATQAAARDVMAANMPAIDERFDIVGTVHDEWITEVEDDECGYSQTLSEMMSRVPYWAEGLPLAADGWDGRRYRK